MHLPCFGPILLAPIVFGTAALCAQTPAPSAQPPVAVFKASAHEVVMEVVVTQGNDEAVTGLHKRDFEVKEDGKPVVIDYFEEHTSRRLPPGAIPPLVKMPPNVYNNVPEMPDSDSVNVLLLDSLNTEKQDQSNVRLQILNFLKNMQPGVRCAIFTLGSKLRYVQGFTADSSVLLAALTDKKTGVSPEKDATSRSRADDQADKDQIAMMVTMMEGHMTEGIESVAKAQADVASYQYGERTAMTMEALQYLARYLGGVPGRKNLIWFAGSFPVTVFPDSGQRENMNLLRVNLSAMKVTADLLTASKIAVYPIGAAGSMDDHPMEASSNFSESGRRGELMSNVMEGAAKRSDTASAMEEAGCRHRRQSLLQHQRPECGDHALDRIRLALLHAGIYARKQKNGRQVPAR